ncbi:MAG: metallophosphoesterase [Actinobacteria bacterium]|nr:metallophosphoesterase [Actinomycetota bacterium]
MINVIVRALPSKYLFFRSGQPTRITSTNPDVDTVTGRALSKRGTDHPKMMVGMIGGVRPMKAWRGMLLSVALVGSVITYALAIEPFWIKTTIHTIRHPAVNAPVRVVQLSDLHLQKFDRISAKVIEEVERLKPDLVVITGDALDKQKALPVLDQFG